MSDSTSSAAKHEGQQNADFLLDVLLVSLGVDLKPPDDEVVKQDDEFEESGETPMYFINTGECKVLVRDHNGRELEMRKLHEGDHFGEIALIY